MEKNIKEIQIKKSKNNNEPIHKIHEMKQIIRINIKGYKKLIKKR